MHQSAADQIELLFVVLLSVHSIVTSGEEVMFYPAFVFLSVGVSVCLSVSKFTLKTTD